MSANRLICLLAAAWLLASGCDDGLRASDPAAGQEPPAGADGGDPVLARVNTAPIYRSDLDASLRRAEANLKGAPRLDSTARARLAAQLLETLIADELLSQHASSLGMRVSDEEVAEHFERLEGAGGGDSTLESFVSESGLSVQQLRGNLVRNLLLKRLQAQIRAEVVVSRPSIQEFYAAHPERFLRPARVVLARIDFGQGSAARAEAEQAVERVRAGWSFEQAARRYEVDPAARSAGGQRGEFDPEDLLPVYAQAIAALQPGQVTGAIQGPDGICVLQMVERQPASPAPFDSVAERIERELRDEEVRKRLGQLAQRLKSEASIQSFPL